MLPVKVQPGARRPGILGYAPDSAGLVLKIAVTAPPEDGRANQAVCTLLARALHIAAINVSVMHGASSRRKTLRLAGDPQTLSESLAAL